MVLIMAASFPNLSGILAFFPIAFCGCQFIESSRKLCFQCVTFYLALLLRCSQYVKLIPFCHFCLVCGCQCLCDASLHVPQEFSLLPSAIQTIVTFFFMCQKLIVQASWSTSGTWICCIHTLLQCLSHIVELYKNELSSCAGCVQLKYSLSGPLQPPLPRHPT